MDGSVFGEQPPPSGGRSPVQPAGSAVRTGAQLVLPLKSLPVGIVAVKGEVRHLTHGSAPVLLGGAGDSSFPLRGARPGGGSPPVTSERDCLCGGRIAIGLNDLAHLVLV